MTDHPFLLLHSDRRHGVARYARELALGVGARLQWDSTVPETSWSSLPSAGLIHAHFTDRLWADSPEHAARRLLSVAQGRRLSLTLHDVPQPSDGHAFDKRVEAYRTVVRAADSVVVNSHHERLLLTTFVDATANPTVIPLPADDSRRMSRLNRLNGAAAVLGFIYPGKGHLETIDAIATSRVPLSFLALGSAAPGHEHDASGLIAYGRSRQVKTSVSGYLSDRRFLAAALSASVPVVAHQHFSASGSINSWTAAGRRPLVLRSRYTEEMASLRPGTLNLVRPDELGDAIAQAAADPTSTFLSPETSTRPHLTDTVGAYLALWKRLAR